MVVRVVRVVGVVVVVARRVQLVVAALVLVRALRALLLVRVVGRRARVLAVRRLRRRLLCHTMHSPSVSGQSPVTVLVGQRVRYITLVLHTDSNGKGQTSIRSAERGRLDVVSAARVPAARPAARVRGRTHLGGSPAAAGQRQPVRPQRARRVQPGHALLALVAFITFAPALAHRTLQSWRTL